MSTTAKKIVPFKLNGKDATAPEGQVIIEAARQHGVEISNLCYNRNLKPFAACRTCMVEVINADGKKELVYSCTHPIAEGMEVNTGTEETDRYNKSCLEMLLVEHPLDCPICDKSGVCPLQDNTEMLSLANGRFEINRRNEPSIKTNPVIEFYLNRCIMCGLCVRACDETQGVQALDFHKRGMKVGIGTANGEPLDCEFCGQCITVCPTGALMDMTSQARGLAALFTNTDTTCNYCSWGCSLKLESKKGEVLRIEAHLEAGHGINQSNLCAKGRFGHGIIHNEERIQTPLMNQGGKFTEISWSEALEIIAERARSTVNRSGPESVAGLGGETLTNEEAYLFQRLFRGALGSNQVTNLAHLRAPYLNRFLLDCFNNGITSKPITELEEADVTLVFNSDLPSEYPVGGNAVRKSAIFTKADVIIANPRNVVFHNESEVDIRLQYALGSDAWVANRLSRIILDNQLVDTGRVKAAVSNYDALVQSLAGCTAEEAEKRTGIADAVLQRTARRFARNADRFILIGNDILDGGQGEATLDALLNLATLVHTGGEGSVSIYPPREHCNSQGVNDMGVTPDHLPGYRSPSDEGALANLAGLWQADALAFDQPALARDLFENCARGKIKYLHIAGEDPMRSYYKGALVKDALTTVPFLVVQDVFMTDTARMADIVLPASTFAEKEGSYTNMTRHVQRVQPAILPQGGSKPDLDIFLDLADQLGKPFGLSSASEVQQEIQQAAPIYKGTLPGNRSLQWAPESAGQNASFRTGPVEAPAQAKEGFPLSLISNNHMFHIGGYTQYAKALVEIGPECLAELHPDDAQELGVAEGDRIVVESETAGVEVAVKVSPVSARGTVYIPKNWPQVPINSLRNGEEGPVSVRVKRLA